MRLRHAVAALLALTAFAAASGATPARAQTSDAPGVRYVAALHRAFDAMPTVATLPRDDPGLTIPRDALGTARSLSPDSAAVDPILADLDRDPADVAGARSALDTLLNALDLPHGAVAEDPGAARNTLHDVYAQSQFSNLGTQASGDSLFSRIGRALLDFFRWLLSHTVGALGTIPALILAALIIAAIVAFVLLRLQRAGTAQFGRGGMVPEPRATGTDPDEEWRLALAAADRGDHREAVRHAFRSALLAIAVAGRLHVDAAWTTSELLARARGDADLVAALAPAADAFDRAWYSGRPVTAEDWEVARGRCQAVRQLAGRRGAAR